VISPKSLRTGLNGGFAIERQDAGAAMPYHAPGLEKRRIA
jgi:hypothetical protein